MRERQIYVVTDVYEYINPQLGCEEETPSCAFATADKAHKCEDEHKRSHGGQTHYTDMRYVDSFVYVVPFQYE